MRLFFTFFGSLFFILLTSCSEKEQQCDVWAYLVPEGREELILRVLPDSEGHPTGQTEFMHDVGTECHLLKAKGKWGYAECEPKTASDPDARWIQGWLELKNLEVGVGPYNANPQNENLYLLPSYGSKNIKIPVYKDSIYGQVISCQGEWLKVRIKEPTPKMLEQIKRPDWPQEDLEFFNKIKAGEYPGNGWLAPGGYCTNPLTTCI